MKEILGLDDDVFKERLAPTMVNIVSSNSDDIATAFVA